MVLYGIAIPAVCSLYIHYMFLKWYFGEIALIIIGLGWLISNLRRFFHLGMICCRISLEMVEESLERALAI